ncbi:hypothetical protein FJ444_01465 [Aestuariibacter sp. GS-14]|uniref:hypothetical protein n=1 Tax=Aestuariibacter sp. GS-14 TaxID=2590670 RepID=UPI00112D45FF|nr:hypothetical protein [Aestuariibacter sp. GS-14]TPV61965.1 hypothetical protein FJ444_01465 [Aestuariibacter sp. GS-14]
MKKQQVAVIGTGSSAEQYLSTVDVSCDFTFFNSSGQGEFRGQSVQALSSLRCDAFDSIVIAVYDYGELLPLINGVEDARLHWFDAKKSELMYLTDPYFDNPQACLDNRSVLTVIYDMRVAPPTFDFLVFLVKCRLVANERKLARLKVIIAPGDNNGFRANIDFFSVSEMNFRVTHLLLPLVKLVDPTADLHLVGNRAEARKLFQSAEFCYPENHNFVNPVAKHHYFELFRFMDADIEHRIVEPSEICRRQLIEWLSTRDVVRDKLVTITLRESDAHTGRNSQVEIWREVASRLVNSGYDVVVVRDTAKALIPLDWDGVVECPLAAVDVEMRAALYDLSWLNLAISSGPLALCLLMKQCRYILFGMYNASCTSNTYEHLERIGFAKDCDQIKGGGDGQFICWNDVTAENVLSEITQKFGVTIQ